jgi:hypothetical protein
MAARHHFRIANACEAAILDGFHSENGNARESLSVPVLNNMCFEEAARAMRERYPNIVLLIATSKRQFL